MTTKTRGRLLVAGSAKGYPPQAVMRAEVLRLIQHRLSSWPLDDLAVIGMITGRPEPRRLNLLKLVELLVLADAEDAGELTDDPHAVDEAVKRDPPVRWHG